MSGLGLRRALLTTALLCGVLLSPGAGAYKLVVTEDLLPAHWDKICIPWYVQKDGTPDLTPAEVMTTLETSFETWSAVPGIYPELQGRGATCFDDVGLAGWPGRQNVMMWREGTDSWPYAAPVVGLTSVTFDRHTGVIVDADVEFNGEDYLFAADVSNLAYDLQSAATHEVGHVLGLGHSGDPEATMYAKSQPGETKKRDLESDDIAGIQESHPVAEAPSADTACDEALQEAPFEAPYCPDKPHRSGCAAATETGAAGGLLCAVLMALATMGRWRRRFPRY